MALKPRLEKSIETEILNVLKLKGLFFFKVNKTGIYDAKRKVFRSNKNPHAINGIADIIGCVQGRFVAIEVKSKSGRMTPDQLRFQTRINDEGGLSICVNNLSDCLEILSEELDLDLV